MALPATKKLIKWLLTGENQKHKPTVWVCSVCQKKYSTYDEALRCKGSHQTHEEGTVTV